MMEGCQREWKIVGNNRTEVETKAEMKEKTGKSPDLFDGLAIGMEGARRRGFIITGMFAKAMKEIVTQKWKTELREKARSQWSQGNLTYS